MDEVLEQAYTRTHNQIFSAVSKLQNSLLLLQASDATCATKTASFGVDAGASQPHQVALADTANSIKIQMQQQTRANNEKSHPDEEQLKLFGQGCASASMQKPAEEAKFTATDGCKLQD